MNQRTRRGISFTLTMVVAGVILITTALTVVTLGGGALSNFFGILGDKQTEQVEESDIRSACQELKTEINNDYCNEYLKATYNGPTTGCSVASGSFCGDRQTIQNTYNEDEWEITCRSEQQDTRVVTSIDLANKSEPAYPRTATDLNCDLSNYGGLSGFSNNPTVTISGNSYNCVNKGYITQTTCPVQ